MKNKESFKKWDFKKLRRLAKEIREYTEEEAKNSYKYREQNEEFNKERIHSRDSE